MHPTGESIVSMRLSNAITAWGIVKAAGAQRCFPQLAITAIVIVWGHADTCEVATHTCISGSLIINPFFIVIIAFVSHTPDICQLSNPLRFQRIPQKFLGIQFHFDE